jgi:hypothetical protein
MMDESQLVTAWGISVGSMYWSVRGASLNGKPATQIRHRKDKSIPASVLIGWAIGEPARFDCWLPPHPRGTGSNWPLDAIVNGKQGSGRFPLAAAWTGRHYELPWRWKPDSECRQLDSLDAICLGISQIAKMHAHKATSAIVIPNDFKQREQQRLLDSCSAAGVSASLIWLPVAAVLAWLEELRDKLPNAGSQSDKRLSVLVVHADWGIIRCSILNLVVSPKEFGLRWIPARRRPAVSDWETVGFGWDSVAGCNADDAPDIWRSIFGGDDRKSPSISVANSNLLQQIAGWSVDQSRPEEVDTKLAAYIEKSHPLTGALFVGDFARKVSCGPKVARAVSCCATRVADGLEGEDLLALGALIFAQARLKGQTSYLDTLPNLELFVDRGTHYDWLRLLGDEDQFVSGGKPWELPNPIEGLAVRRGASSIKLVVAHDEYKGVREIQIALERAAEVDLGAKLGVSATPAQGNARLLLTTFATSGCPSRTILANWDRMERLFEKDGTTPLDKKNFELSRPKAFPNLRPRAADPSRWCTFAYRARKLLAEVKDAGQLSSNSITLGPLLDSTRITSGCSAVSSEGCAPPGGEQGLVDKISSLLFDYLKKQTYLNQRNRIQCDAVKTLAFMSVSLDGLDKWISDSIGYSGNIDEPVCMIAGCCIRTPEVAELFVRRLLAHIPVSNRRRLLNYQMQALGRLLSQRQDIMSKFHEIQVYQLIEECLKVFRDEIERDNLAWLFEHSGLVVVYTLRYRIYQPEFLDPVSNLAIQAKEQFEIAIQKLSQRLSRSARMFGNNSLSPERIRRLTSALQQLIDYIDKRGEGDILLALED